ncbi:hypothetical protein [uncultured Hymenobacter sp.]|uniref:hypothetical protein n=1 Tax=uncultured Hymenobacter sp. TaxID=170016 RepID=UPI0035CB0302
MNLLRPFAGLLLVLAGLSGALSGCLSAPTYPIEPSIDFKDLSVVRSSPGRGVPTDTFKITIDFKDGDGDLGLTAAEIAAPPYDTKNPDGSFNPNQEFNYYLRVYQRVPPSTQFEEIIALREYSHFPLLNGSVDGKTSPLKGDLTFRRFFAFGSPFNAGDEVRFTVSIKDRALNESNTVTSSTHVMLPR